MNFRHAKLFRNAFRPVKQPSAEYSRKNNPNLEKFYKLVVKVDNASQQNNPLAPIPNWEILKPRGYRFFLPGNVGPGWHDMRSNAHTLPLDNRLQSTSSFRCYAQECPVLLRQNVSELFPGVDFSYSELTIVSLSHRKVLEENIEEMIKTFVLLAQDVSQKLRNAGFWADFINPFSGLPSVNKYNTKEDLYTTDPKFRSLGFRITVRNNCRLIEGKRTKHFRGSLFTTAPADADILRDLLLPDDDYLE